MINSPDGRLSLPAMITPSGSICDTQDDGAGFAATCIQNIGAEIPPHEFLMPDGKSLKAPFPELDNDTDGYVECEFFEEQIEKLLSGLDQVDSALERAGAPPVKK